MITEEVHLVDTNIATCSNFKLERDFYNMDFIRSDFLQNPYFSLLN